MYVPEHFAERRLDVLHSLIRRYPFATLVTMSSHGPDADHLPFVLETGGNGPDRLQGHIARRNPAWERLGQGAEVLVLFQGPDVYISPDWYPSKQQAGRVVPTWNYVVAHVHGVARAIDDPDWLLTHLHVLTNAHEAAREQPWSVDDAPPDYVERLLNAIVGIEITISGITGKLKVGQNLAAQDRSGVITELHREDTDAARSVAKWMADAAGATDHSWCSDARQT